MPDIQKNGNPSLPHPLSHGGAVHTKYSELIIAAWPVTMEVSNFDETGVNGSRI